MGVEYRFRRLTRAEFPLLAEWLAAPHVHRWWQHDHRMAAVERDFGDAADGAEPSEDLLVLRDEVPIGLVQRSRLADYPQEHAAYGRITEFPAAAVQLDYLIGEVALTGRGIGPELLRAAVADTWPAYPDAPAVVVGVVAANYASWRALERAGFRRVGQGELPPDNPVDPPLHYLYRIDRPGDESLVRPASAHDLDAVFELASMMAVTFTVEAEAFERSFAAVVAASDAHLLVVDVAGQVEGYLLGFEHPSFYANGPVAWVEEIAVRAELRRRDLGSRLMADFERRVRDGGGRLVALATTRAGPFYAAIGYDRHAAYFRKIL